MQWFRMYHEMRHDTKVRALSNELFRFWISCLCISSEQAERGVLPPCDEIAIDLRMRRDVVVRFVKELVVGGFLHPRYDRVTTASEPSDDRVTTASGPSDDRVWAASVRFDVHAWRSRQPSRDNTAPYVRASRKKGSRKAAAADVMRSSCDRNAAGNAAGNASVRPPELELELEIKNPPLDPPPPGKFPTLTDQDRAHIRSAEKLLAGNLMTEAFAMELGRVAGNTRPGEGWKWLRAAERILAPNVPDKKRTWQYLCGILRGLTDADRDTSPAAPRRSFESAAERRQRELDESFAIRMAEAKAREARP